MYDHTCGVSKTARIRCVPCALESSFKPATVERVTRIPRSPHRLFDLEYARMEDFERYHEDADAGFVLRFRGRQALKPGDTVWVRWQKPPRARRWRLEVRLDDPTGGK